MLCVYNCVYTQKNGFKEIPETVCGSGSERGHESPDLMIMNHAL